MKNTYLVCPIIVPCHSSVYFSKKFFFVLFFLFVYTPFMNSSVILSWYSLSLFICLPSFIKPCILNSPKCMLTVFFPHLTAHTGQQHFSGCLQECEEYSVFPPNESLTPVRSSLAELRPLGGQISPDSRRIIIFLLFGLALRFDIFCASVSLPPFVCVQQ